MIYSSIIGYPVNTLCLLFNIKQQQNGNVAVWPLMTQEQMVCHVEEYLCNIT